MGALRYAGFISLVLAIVAASCAPAPGAPALSTGDAGLRPQVGPKVITAATRGDPPTLAVALNAGSGGSTAGVRDMWARVGVGGDPVVVAEQLATSDPAIRAEFRSLRFQFNPVNLQRYLGSGTPLPENRFRGNNYSRYRSAELDALIDRYYVTIQKGERTQVLGDIVHHMTDQLNVLTLFHDTEPVMLSNRLINAGGRRGLALQAWNAHEWDLR